MKTIIVVFGTRPETIKLAPFILEAKKRQNGLKVLVCSTGQHREMIKPLFEFFGIKPDFDLDLMKPGQTLVDISIGVMEKFSHVVRQHQIDGVVVQGDTTSCFIASLVAFYHQIPVIHVEAGLRSGDMCSPFPEEFNRRATGLVTKLHFAPTETAKENLLREHYAAEDIYVTGNTGIDALFQAKKNIENSDAMHDEFKNKYSFLDSTKKLILVTIHRRESFGQPLEEVMKGLLQLAAREDVEILLPLHMNPAVRKSAEKILSNHSRWIDKGSRPEKGQTKIWICEPVDYIPFVYLMSRSYMIITDSGGVQEEAPSLGKPVLVAREKTERPEAIEAGTSKLIPLNEKQFCEVASQVLDDKSLYSKMAQAKNPFGDGHSCERIVSTIIREL